MKKTFILLILMIFIYELFAQGKEIVVVYDVLKINGAIKKITGVEYKEYEDSGKKIREDGNKHIIELDKNGNIIYEKEIFSYYTKSKKCIYDEKNNIIEVANYDEKDELSNTNKYIYQDGILLEKQTFTSGDDTPTRVIYTNKNGKPEEILAKYKDGSISSKNRYKYDKNGNMLEEIEYDTETDKPDSKDVYKYDAKNKVTEKQIFSTNILNYKTTYKYHTTGALKEEIEIEYEENIKKKEAAKTIIKYNDKGNRISFEKFNGKDLSVMIKYTYDNNDNLIEENELDPTNGNIIKKIKYQYDSNGNLVLKTVYDSDNYPVQYMEVVYETF